MVGVGDAEVDLAKKEGVGPEKMKSEKLLI